MKLKNLLYLTLFVVSLLSCSNDDDGGGVQLDNIVLSAPSDGATPVSKTPQFTWETYDNESTVTYSVHMGTTAENLSKIVSDLSTTAFTIEEADALELETEYFWKVMAYVDGNSVAESAVQNFIVETISPTLLTEDALYGARKGTAVVVFNDKIWVIGGRDETDTPLSDIWSSADGTNWTNEGNVPTAIYGHKAIEFNGKLWIYGGIVGGLQSNIIYSSTDGINWNTETETTPFIQYQSPRFTVLGNKIFRIAGYSGDVDDLSPERNVYSSTDGLSWNLETANHGFDTKYEFLIENLNGILYCMEPNPDANSNEIKVRTSTTGITWSAPLNFDVQEIGINSVRSTVLDSKIILMTTPDSGSNFSSTFYESMDGENWTAATSLSSVAIRAIFYHLVNLNGSLFAIGGTQRSNFSQTNNTVWKLN